MKLMKKIVPSLLAASLVLSFTGCGGGGGGGTTDITPTTNPQSSVSKTNISGNITIDTTWTKDNVYLLEGLVTVNSGATLTIEPGTVILGKAGTGAATSYMVVDKDAKIIANGTAGEPIVFMGETAFDGGADTWGQWGGLVLIGNAGVAGETSPYEVDTNFIPGTSNPADNSGSLKYVKILNSGITMAENKEINGLSMVGVGSGTVVENITVNKSDDDCVEIWGGTVNLTNVNVSECSDDHFDVDEGYTGTVTNLSIYQTTGNSGIEMSGNSIPKFENLDIYISNAAQNTFKEGAIYFKKDGIAAQFTNATVQYDVNSSYPAIYSVGANNVADTSFTNVHLIGSNANKIGGDTDMNTLYESGINNTK